MPVHELAALGAAACWAMTGVLAPGPIAHLGALAFNRWRQVFAVLMFAAVVAASGTWRQFDAATVAPLVLSGLIGIFLGDSLLFTAVGRLGPRRAGVLFALNAPIAALLGWLVLGETLSAVAVAGIALTVAGVALAILYGRGSAPGHAWEVVKGSLLIGAAAGLGAATGQATGSLIARPVMAAGFDPFAASLLRVVVAAAGLTLLARLPHRGADAAAPADAAGGGDDGADRVPGARRRDDAGALCAGGGKGRHRLDAVRHLPGADPAAALAQDRPAPRRRARGRARRWSWWGWR